MSRRRVPPLSTLNAAFLAVALSATCAAAGSSNVKAQFEVRLGPMQIGRGNFEAQITDSSYSIGVNARIIGVARLVAGGDGSASAQGTMRGEHLAPSLYHISNTAGYASNEIRLLMRANNVVSETVIPPSYPFPDRVPLTDAARHGVVDPLSAFVFPVEGGADLAAPGNCNRTLKIFDGRQRYDIALSYDRTEQIRAHGDYEGIGLVCKARYTAIAGHRRAPTDVDTPETYHDMEAWLIPVPGTRALVLYRMQIGTPVGDLLIQASRLSVTPNLRQQAAGE